MTPIATHPLSRRTTGTINPDGVDLAIFSAGVDLPETGHSSYEVALHQDGAPCSPECGCVAVEDRTTIWEGTTITRGEWTWHADRYVLIGLRSTGPTKPELRERIAKQGERIAELEGRVEYLEECWADEREGHHLAKVHMSDDARLIEGLRGELGEAEVERRALEASVRQLNGQLYPLVRELPWLRWGAAIGWGLALVLAAALVWAVVA